MAPSPQRIQAARANGAKSRGPKTAEGKLTASRNAIQHGLTARTVVLQNESEDQYQADLRDYLDHFRPEGKPETDLVHQLAPAHWRLVRYAAVESGLLELKMDDQANWIEDKYEVISERHRLAIAFEALSGTNGSLGLLNRYQARLHREYQRLLKTLIELQTARRAATAKLPKEPKTAAHQPSELLRRAVGGECEQHVATRATDESVARVCERDHRSDFLKQFEAQTPPGPIAQPADIAPITVFLASQDSG
jgi:hypothetical protein